MFTDAAFKRLTLALNSIVGQTAMGVFFFFFLMAVIVLALPPDCWPTLWKSGLAMTHCTVQ